MSADMYTYIYMWCLSVGHMCWKSARLVGSGNISIVPQPTHTLSRLQICFTSRPRWLLALQRMMCICRQMRNNHDRQRQTDRQFKHVAEVGNDMIFTVCYYNVVGRGIFGCVEMMGVFVAVMTQLH